MIPLDKLRAIRHIVSHENCPDGMASAMILRDVLPDAKVTFCQYGTPLHRELEPEEGMLFCDFSPDPGRAAQFIEAGTIVLDHHRTQKDVVAAFGELGVFGDEEADPGVCGAFLAFREVWAPLVMATNKHKLEALTRDEAPGHILEDSEVWTRVREFATLAGIRDTWQKHDPRWRQACEQAEALIFWPQEELLGLAPSQWGEKLQLGPVLYERRLRTAQRCIDGGWRFTTAKGTRVIVFEGTKPTSDAAEILGEEVDFVVGFNYRLDGDDLRIIFSTRSHTTFDCATYAKSHPGGGGHTKAAGFQLPVDPQNSLNPYKMVWEDLHQYEG